MTNNKFALDQELAAALSRADKLRIQGLYYSCPLQKAVNDTEIDKVLSSIDITKRYAENIDKFFSAADYLNLKSVYVGSGELVGRDNVRYDGWPAIWKLAELLDGAAAPGDIHITAGCGNHDQTQVINTEFFFPADFMNRAWDISPRKVLPTELFKHRMVTTKK